MSENNGKVEHRYYFSDSQAGKDICDRRIATVKSHIRCYINEGHDIKSAGDLRLLLILTVVSKGASFSFESEGLRVWKAYNVGERIRDTSGTFSIPCVQIGAFRSTMRRAVLQEVHPSTSQSQVVEPPAGWKIYQSYGKLQKHLDAGKCLFRLERETTYATVKKNGLTPAQMSQLVTYAKKQDQVPKLLLTIQFVRSPKDLKTSRRAIHLECENLSEENPPGRRRDRIKS
ncbi:hypothetical protein P5673_012100 [Acropora cervicornis]|uniref:Uncharacterized protein n=1 Tax=Acropora cervicornis TaxID=6130 RepID=A0AAD9QNJ4_ACRCE|nr:hypothetical protein P5673_012100 [Acropora cervicornis]